MQIYIRRDNEEFGPYSREAALEYVKQGIFDTLDLACYAGMTEWKTVGDLLGIEDDAKPERPSAKRRASHITEFNPLSAPAPVRRRRTRKKSGLKSLVMILLNGVLLFIVLSAAYIRWGGGMRIARPYLLALSVEIAQFANGGLDENPATASVSPAPVTAKPPLVTGSAPASSPAATAVPTPELAATPTPTVASASTPQLVASTSTQSKTSAPELVAASTPPPPASPDSAPASSPAMAEATPPPAAPEPTPEMAGSPTPDLAATSNPPPASSPAPDAPTIPAPESTPTPAPAPPAPPPQPKHFDPAEVAANPGEWPKALKLKQAVTFPVVINAQVVGSVSVPPGADARMVAMQGDQLTLQCRGMTQTISWKLTDLKEQIEKADAIPPPAPPIAPASPVPTLQPPDASSTPVATPSPDSSPPSGN